MSQSVLISNGEYHLQVTEGIELITNQILTLLLLFLPLPTPPFWIYLYLPFSCVSKDNRDSYSNGECHLQIVEAKELLTDQILRLLLLMLHLLTECNKSST